MDSPVVSFETLDKTLADVQKALVYLRDCQDLIECSDDDDDVCNQFDLAGDKINQLRHQFREAHREVKQLVEQTEKHGQPGELEGAMLQYGEALSESQDLWPVIKTQEDPIIS